MTRYEEKILNIINASRDHLTSCEIFMELKKEEPQVVLATVYNNLNRLYENGLINRLSFGGEPERYDRKTPHSHLICVKCRSISDCIVPDLTKRLEEAIGIKIEDYDLKISYTCPKCKMKENS